MIGSVWIENIAVHAGKSGEDYLSRYDLPECDVQTIITEQLNDLDIHQHELKDLKQNKEQQLK